MSKFKRTGRLAVCLSTVIFFAAAAAPAAHAQTAQSADQSGVPQIVFEKYTLPNGLQVILHVDRKLPMVHVNSWYHVGSKNERVGRTGFAHLFEHMMFEGSKDANGKYFGFIEKAGANLFEGGVNGTTKEDRTNYFETVPSGNLDYVLWLESDRLATLTDVLTKEKLDNERAIVRNERRQGLENQPYGRAFMLLQTNIFPAGHPYSHDVIGSHEDLIAASVDDVKEFFHQYYTPNNLSLAITGDFDPAQAKRLIAKYYTPIPPGPPLDRPKHWVQRLDSPKVIEVKDHVPQERTYFGWPSPAFFDAGDADLDLASLILADGLSSRLQRSLVYDKQLCSNVAAFQASSEIAGMFIIQATARPGAALAQVEQGVTEEIARLAKEGPTTAELNRAKAKWELQYLTGLERIGGFGGQADLLNQYNTFFGDPNKFAADVTRHRNATTESVKEAVASWINTPNRVLVRFHPDQAKLDTSAKVDRSQIPAFGTDRPFQAPHVETAKLDNGMSVFVVERKDLPKVSVTFATRAGSVYDPVGQEGLASLTAESLIRGTKNRKALEIDDALADLGTTAQANSGREYSTVNLEVLENNLPKALGIVSDVVRNPSFPADEVDRLKKQTLDSLSQAENSPRMIAARLSTMLAFGREHPYGHPVRGFPSTVSKLNSDELAKFHEKYWKPGSSAVILVGDVSLQQAVDLTKTNFGSWVGGSAPAPQIGQPQPLGPGKVYLVNRPDAAQTYIEEILPAPRRDAPDYYAFSLADVVWGGSAGARLGMNLREQKGYSYGVFSFPDYFSKYGVWIAGGGVQTDKTKESVVEFQKELKYIAGEKPVTEAELTNAKSNRVRGYAQQFESMNRVSQQIVELWSLGLPFSELQREPDELSKTTLDRVNAAAEKYAAPAKSTLLLVGDLSKIEAGVRSVDTSEIVQLDAEGRPVKPSSSH